MKKTILAFAAICAIGLLFTSMGKNKLTSITGHINFYGNVPFEEPAFKSEDGTIFVMGVAPEASFSLKDVLSKQGHRLQLDGTIEKATLEDSPLGINDKFIIHAYKTIPAKAE